MLVCWSTSRTAPISPSGVTTGSSARHALGLARVEQQRAAVGREGLVQHLGGDEAGAGADG